MLSYIIQLVFPVLPDTRLYHLKVFLLRLRGFRIGRNVRVVSSVRFKLRMLSVGDNTFIGHQTLIAGGNALVHIGQNVDIAARCMLMTGTHEIGSSIQRAGKGRSDNITIGDGTWVGAGAIILGGVHIGRGCIIGAGSLVRKDVEDNCLVAGVPARVIRKLP